MKNNFKNAYEVSCIHRDKTIFVESYLQGQDETSAKYDYSPLMFHGHFSRYVLNLINENKKIASDNIGIDAIRNIIRKSKIVYEHEFLNSFEQPSTSVKSYSDLQIKMGKFKNKTISQVFAENGDSAITELQNYCQFLNNLASQNSKYASANRRTINAIQEAIQDYQNGNLDTASSSTKTKTYEIYKVESRVNSYKEFTVNGVKMYPVRSTYITWNSGLKNPVNVRVVNYKAPIKRLENGLTVAVPDQKDNSSFVEVSMNLSASEWMNFLDNIQDDLDRFKFINCKFVTEKALQLANQMRKENENNQN